MSSKVFALSLAKSLALPARMLHFTPASRACPGTEAAELTRAGVSNKNKCMPVLKKKLYIRTFGCQMNQADSQQMARFLAPEYEVTCRAEEADL